MINIFKKKKEIEGAYENYYEGLIRANKRQFYMILFLAFILFFTINAVRKPPMVIPVFADGSFEVIKDYRKSSPITQESVSFFADTFVRNLNLTDSFGIKEKLPIALSMMASPLQDRYKRHILTTEKLAQVKELGWLSRTKIVQRNFRRNGDIISVDLRYARDIEDTSQNLRFTVNHRAEIKIQALSKPTSDYPLSLQVVSYNTQKME